MDTTYRFLNVISHNALAVAYRLVMSVPMDIIKQIGPALRNSRIRLGMTRDEVAATAGVSPSILSGLENGRRADLSLSAAERICDTVGLELGLVVRGQAIPLVLPAVTRRRVRRSP